MNVLPGWRQWLQALIEPTSSPVLDTLVEAHQQHIPVLWLMGKTAAGKSSIIQRLTGDSQAQIGNGFEPCTRTAAFYDHPKELPVLRFLDTRGLGETDYDPSEDLNKAQQGSHALLVITRVDDPSQDIVLNALQAIKSAHDNLPILHIHTALHSVSSADRERAITHNTQQVCDVLGRQVPSVNIDFTAPDDGFEDPDLGLHKLQSAIVDMVPELTRVLSQHTHDSQEEDIFLSVRKEVLGYAGATAAADLLPAVGLVAVPSLQGKMLHALAGRYRVSWDKRVAGEFIAALGSSFLYRYLISLGTRQIAKLIPFYGQSAGAAAAASISFASTYALGRAACLYFYRRNHDQPIDSDQLRKAFQNAFKEQR